MADWYRFTTANDSEVMVDLDQLTGVWKGIEEGQMVIQSAGIEDVVVLADFNTWVIEHLDHYDLRIEKKAARPPKKRAASSSPVRLKS